MTREQLNAKLDRTDISGIGVECIAANGSTVYYFYEDFDGPARPTASCRRCCPPTATARTTPRRPPPLPPRRSIPPPPTAKSVSCSDNKTRLNTALNRAIMHTQNKRRFWNANQ